MIRLLFLSLVLSGTSARADAVQDFDVVVIGGSSGGIGAALGAARLHARVALIEDTPVLGGMLANGISNIDCFSRESLSGVFEEFRAAVRAHYEPAFATDPIFKTVSKPSHMDGRSGQWNTAAEGGRWEPHVADEIFKALAAKEPTLTVFYQRFATGVEKSDRRLTAVLTETDKGERITFRAPVFIDCTHEADIAAWAGVPYRVGREARSPLEPHAGQQFFYNSTGEILPGSSGQQDPAVPSYGLRLCVKNYPEGDESHLLPSPPPGYDAAQFQHTSYSGKGGVPNGKAEMNANPIGNELQVINWSWPEASRAERLRLSEVYLNHALSFLYYLQHEKGRRNLGLPDDEFIDHGHVPYRVFTRECRRIEGVVTMTESDINPFLLGHGYEPPRRPDSVGIGHYPIDAKPVRPKTDFTAPDKGEGDFFLLQAMSAFQVPYGAILPREIDGLLVPVGLSATHVAFSAVRMDPTWVVLGQAAGLAGAISAQHHLVPRAVPLEALQRELVRQKIKLAFFWDVEATHPAFEAIQLLAVRGAALADGERLFHPDAPLTRADAAVLLYHAFALWPSVSNAHFSDAPAQHPAFREIETLYDHGALTAFGLRPIWPKAGPYDASKHTGFSQKFHLTTFEPEKPVTSGELHSLIEQLSHHTVGEAAGPGPAVEASPAPVTRGEACQRIWEAVAGDRGGR